MICTVIDCVGPCESTQWPKYLFGTANIICISHCISRLWRIYPPHGNCSSLNPWWNKSHHELMFHFLGGCLSISFFLIFFARPKGGFLKSHSRRGSLYAEDFSFFERKSFSFLGCYYRSALDRETLVVRSSSKSIDELYNLLHDISSHQFSVIATMDSKCRIRKWRNPALLAILGELIDFFLVSKHQKCWTVDQLRSVGQLDCDQDGGWCVGDIRQSQQQQQDGGTHSKCQPNDEGHNGAGRRYAAGSARSIPFHYSVLFDQSGRQSSRIGGERSTRPVGRFINWRPRRSTNSNLVTISRFFHPFARPAKRIRMEESTTGRITKTGYR